MSRHAGHEPPPHYNANEDLPDWVHGAQTGSGIARVRLFALLSEHEPLRQFFADLGRGSGVIERNATRLELSPYERRTYRAMGIPDPGYERFLANLRPWHVEATDAPGMANTEIESAITAFIEKLRLPWPWLGQAAVGAFTWYVYEVSRELAWTEGNMWDPDNPWTAPPPTPTSRPCISEWFWGETEGPRLAEDKAFGPLYLYRGDSPALARSRLAEHVEEVEQYLQSVERPAVPLGANADWRRATIARNVGWLFRRLVLEETESGLALAEFAPDATDPDVRADVIDSRRKDIRAGVKSARQLLAQRPHRQPILTLAEFERGRMTL